MKIQDQTNLKDKRPFVCYYRVSTKKQGSEMAAQRTAVKNYLKKFWPPEKSFTEIESGAKSDRPELKEALEYCKKKQGTLIVAKLDRLSRDLEFIAKLQKSSVDFVCADCPTASKETLAVMGIFAQYEREQIAKRTTEALAEKRKAGVLLGSNNPKVQAGLVRWREKKARERKRQADKIAKKRQLSKQAKARLKKRTYNYVPVATGQSKRELFDKSVLPTIKALRIGQNLSFEKVAVAMNKAGIQTRQSGKWSQTLVMSICKRNGL